MSQTTATEKMCAARGAPTAPGAAGAGDQRSNVIVIGAGLAGLTAAERLVRHGLTVRVLEARGRVGGRTYSRELAGQSVDLGAEHIGPNHKGMLALTKRLGIRVSDSGLFRAKSRWQVGGLDKVGNLPPARIRDLLRSGAVMARVKQEARKLPIDEPWNAPTARFLDRVSLADWLDAARITGSAREVHNALWEDGFTVEIERISMLQIAWTVRRSGGVVAAIRDIIAYEVEGGTQTIAEALAQKLGFRVTLEAPVELVARDGDELSVVTADETTYQAEQVIVAVPVPTVRRIRFAPPLPDHLAEAHDEVGFGRATTIIVGSGFAPRATVRLCRRQPGLRRRLASRADGEDEAARCQRRPRR
ncbi:MAG: flavin monoamine oxidase family protein [Solirubrobacterales bacterium]